MANELLRVSGLRVNVGGREILHGVDLTVRAGQTHVIMGPNGAGKSTLGNALMGNPAYEVTGGEASLGGEELLSLSPDERARRGLFMSFQNPVEVPGISLESFIRAALESLEMDESYASRDLNVGFSGGEKKKAEILQLIMLRPALAILDETDSGLDVDAVRTVSRGIEEFRRDKDAALIIITHSTGILSSLRVDAAHVIADGRIAAEGGPELIDEIGRDGFRRFEREGG